MVNTLRPRRLRPTALSGLARLLGVAAEDADVVITGVTLDSRAVRPGDLYAALPGARTHGARFADQAGRAGAVAVLTDDEGATLLRAEEIALPVLVHPDPRGRLGSVAALIHGTHEQALPVIGITGTNGKTTTAYLIQSALTALGAQVGLIGTVETRIGDERVRSVRTTPEAPELHGLLALMAEHGLDCCVMEVSSHALSQHRVDGVVFDLALFTNLSQDHLDFHGDMDQYFAAKADLFTAARARHGLVCVDDDWGLRLAGTSGIPVTTLTTRDDRPADWRVIAEAGDPTSFRLTDGERDLRLRSALPGAFNVANTAMAAVALMLLGRGADEVATAVLTDPHVPGRMERVGIPDGGDVLPRVIVDYAHTPDAIRAALEALRPSTPGLLVALTGAGGDRDRDKRWAMGEAAALADVVVITDDNPRSEDPAAIRDAILRGVREADTRGRRVDVIEVGDRRAAIHAAIAAACGFGPVGPQHVDQSGSRATVVVAGKGHESGQEVAGEMLPFDDREACEDVLREVLEDLRNEASR